MKEKIKIILKYILKFSPLYHKTYASLQKKKYNCKSDLEQCLKYNVDYVPYYKRYKKNIADSVDISVFPIIYKKDLMGREKELISCKYNKRYLREIETGGSTGFSLKLFRSVFDVIKEAAFTDYAFSHIGKNLRIGVLRGTKPSNGIFEVISKNRIIFSSYNLNVNTLDTYIYVLNKYKINCLHVYPSSLVILSRLIKTKYGKANLPYLKGILSSSEIFSSVDKKMVCEVFSDVKIVDYYSQNEQTCCAISINDGFFDFNFRYGYVEFRKTGEFFNGNLIAEIISTSIMNKTMPFVRYATEDYVELDNNGNVISIIGRTSDFAVNQDGQLVPCIVLTRNRSLKNVLNFQYYQNEVGVLNFRVVVNTDFSDEDVVFIKEDFATSFDNKMMCNVLIFKKLDRTKVGKQKRLIQELDINIFK